MRKKTLFMISLVCVFGLIAQAEAETTIDVDNYSFELPGTEKCKNWDGETTYPDVPGWTDGDATATDSGVEQTQNGVSDGSWAGFLKSDDAAVYQVVTSHTIGGGEYTLTVDSRATSGSSGANLQLTMELFYDDGGVQTSLGTQNVTVPDRASPYDWGTFSLTLNSASIPPEARGNHIGIKFNNDVNINGAGTWIGIDNVRLTYTSGGASNPDPGDGDTVNKDEITQLSWTLIPEAATCEVYFGTEPNMLTMDSIYFDPAVESVDIDDFPSFSTPLNADTYHWRVDAWGSDPVDPNYFEGTYWRFIATAAPIFESISPAYQAKFAGESADEITVSFSSSSAMSYAWYRSDDDATDTPPDDPVGTDSDTLSLGTLALDDAGYYYCVADNGGSTPSDTARVSIKRQIIHYAFDGNVEDSSGNDLDGIHIGEPNFVNDAIFGQSLWFDGTSDYVQCPNDLDMTTPAFNDFSPGMTVTVWVKPDAVADWQRFIDFGSGPGVNNIFFTRYSNTDTLRFDTLAGDDVDAEDAIALNEWQMFAATMDGDGNVVLYKNGVPLPLLEPIDTVGLPAIAPRTLNYIGESNWSGDDLYSGLMDDLQVWNYALTDDDIANMYVDGAGTYCRYPISENYDYDDNCIVNLADFANFASMWLECGLYPECTF